MMAGFADRLIFFPPLPSYGEGTEGLVRFTSALGDDIAAVHDVDPDAPLTVLFAHGNAEDVGDGATHFARYRVLGPSVLAFDYPGYGLSSGTPSEKGSYAAADAACDYLIAQGVRPEAIVMHGRSLGGAVMVDLASRRRAAGLVIESSFVSAYRVVTRVPLLPLDQFSSLRKLRDVHVPVLIVHGDRDEVIPFWHGRRLFDVVPADQRSALWVEGAGHNDLLEVAGERYWDALATFLAKIEAAL